MAKNFFRKKMPCILPYNAKKIRNMFSRLVRDLAQKAKWSKILWRKRIQALPTISNNLWQSLIGINPHQSPITISFVVCKSQKSKYVGKSMKPVLECLEFWVSGSCSDWEHASSAQVLTKELSSALELEWMQCSGCPVTLNICWHCLNLASV